MSLVLIMIFFSTADIKNNVKLFDKEIQYPVIN